MMMLYEKLLLLPSFSMQ